mmetsp:Transcript_17674/g.23576  ORF Transcript_17674/g.23576 Transcript_17674/m.23576 type:complete len:332 (+) Transcript_17674:3-998(+)
MMILSPAKTLDLTPYDENNDFPSLTTPSCDSAKTSIVASSMKKRKKADLTKLLSISAKLGDTAYQYWSDFDLENKNNPSSKPAMFAFDGPAYKALSATTCSPSIASYLQNNLRIIDPLYGVLRPLDTIQPYRLEMASKNVLSSKEMMDGDTKLKSLADWWSAVVTSSLSSELEQKENEKILVNLASDEYSSAVTSSSLPEGTQYIKVVFQTGGKVASVHAKRARGLMARYIAEHNVQDVKGLKGFDLEGYSLKEEGKKKGEDVLVFDREKPPPKATAAKKTKAEPAKTAKTTTGAKIKTTGARKKAVSPKKRENDSSEETGTKTRAKRSRK